MRLRFSHSQFPARWVIVAAIFANGFQSSLSQTAVQPFPSQSPVVAPRAIATDFTPIGISPSRLIVFWRSNDSLFSTVSADSGVTWGSATFLFKTGSSPAGLQAAALSTGKVLLVWKDALGLEYSSSSDSGVTFTPAAIVSAPSDIPYGLSQTTDGKVWLSYTRSVSGESNNVYYRTSTDSGTTWSGETALRTGTANEQGAAFVSGNGSTIVAMYQDNSDNLRTYIYRMTSTDGGTSWSAPTRMFGSDTLDRFTPRLVRLSDGTLVMVLTENRRRVLFSPFLGSAAFPLGGYALGDIVSTKSTDGGDTWDTTSALTRFAGTDNVPRATLLGNLAFVSFNSVRYAGAYYYGIVGITSDPNPPPDIEYRTTTAPAQGTPLSALMHAIDETGVGGVQAYYTKDGLENGPYALYDDGTHGDYGAGDDIYGGQLGTFNVDDVIANVRFVVTDNANTVTSFLGAFTIPAVHNLGNVLLAMGANSVLGSNGGDNSASWPKSEPYSYLYTGGLWIGGKVGTEARVMESHYSTFDWRRTPGTATAISEDAAVQAISMVYDDSTAISTPLGLRVMQTSYQWSDNAHDDGLVIRYRIENRGVNPFLDSIFVGLWTDPDVPPTAGTNLAGYDSLRNMVYLSQSSQTGGYIGIRLLSSNHPLFSAVFFANGAESEPTTDAGRYASMRSGVKYQPASIADYRLMPVASPFGLAAGQAETITFALVLGNGLTQLQTNSDSIAALYERTVANDIGDPGPLASVRPFPGQSPFTQPRASATDYVPVALSTSSLLTYFRSNDSVFVIASNDWGKSWGNIRFLLKTGASPSNLQAIRLTSGRILLAWHDAGGMFFVTSDDNGTTYSPASNIFATSDFPYALSQTADGTAWLSYSRSVTGQSNNSYYRKSTNNGASWGSENVFLTTAANEQGAVFVSTTGPTVLAFHSDNSLNNKNHTYVSSTTDGGTTWTAATQLFATDTLERFAPRVTRGSDGMLTLVMADLNRRMYSPFIGSINYPGGYALGDVVSSMSTDNGATWSAPSPLTSFAGTDNAPRSTLLGDLTFVSFNSVRYLGGALQALGAYYYGILGVSGDPNPPPNVDYVATSAPEQGVPLSALIQTNDETGIVSAQAFCTKNGIESGPFTLFDDGAHGDYEASDGVYGGQLNTFNVSDVVDVRYVVADNANTVTWYLNGVIIPAVHNAGNVKLALKDNSVIGSSGGVGNSATWPASGGDDYLFTGGLWVGGKVGPAARVMEAHYSTFDWRRTPGTTVTIGSGPADQVITMTYDDSLAGSVPLGLRVTQKSYQWSDPNHDDGIVFSYRLENRGVNPFLDSLLVGLWTDPDVPPTAGNNIGGFDSSRQMLYLSQSSQTGGFIGFRLLSPSHPLYSAVFYANGAEAEPFTDANRYASMRSGVHYQPAGVSDYRIMPVASPFGLAAGQTETITYALVLGNGLSELEANSDSIAERYFQTIANNIGDPGPLATVKPFPRQSPFALPRSVASDFAPVALSTSSLLVCFRSNDSLFTIASNDWGKSWGSVRGMFQTGAFPSNIQATRLSSGRIIIAWRDGDGMRYVNSDDNGTSFSPPASFSATADNPYSISQTSDGKVWLSYTRSVTGQSNNIYYRTSTDNGATWSGEMGLRTGTANEVGATFISGGGSTVSALYHDNSDNLRTHVYSMSSTDGGTNWSPPARMFASDTLERNTPKAMRLSNGTFVLVFSELRRLVAYSPFLGTPAYPSGGYALSDIAYSTSHDGGATWSATTAMTQFAGTDNVPRIALLGDLPFVSFNTVRYTGAYYYGILGITADPNPPPDVEYATSTAPEQGVPFSAIIHTIDETGIVGVEAYYTKDNVQTGPAPLYDDGAHDDYGSGDGIYGGPLGTFNPGDVIDIRYVVTDNANTLYWFLPGVSIPAVHNAGNVKLALRQNSVLGTSGGDNSAKWPKIGGLNYLYTGGLWVGGKVGSEARVMEAHYSTFDWRRTVGTPFAAASDASMQTIAVTYDDSSALSSPLGLRVLQKSYQWTAPSSDDGVVITYRLENRGVNSQIDSIFVGLWTDPDVPPSAGTNMGGYDSVRQMLYVSNSSQTGGYFGLRVLSNSHPLYSSVFYATGAGTEPFTDAGRYASMSSGVKTQPGGVSDFRIMPVAAPFGLAAGQSETVAFALVLGNGIEELRTNSDSIAAHYSQLVLTDVEEQPEESVPLKFALEQNFPNPFNPTTTIRFSLASQSHVRLVVRNILGEEIATLVERELPAGVHSASWDARTLSTGVYFCTIWAGDFVATRRMVLIK